MGFAITAVKSHVDGAGLNSLLFRPKAYTSSTLASGACCAKAAAVVSQSVSAQNMPTLRFKRSLPSRSATPSGFEKIRSHVIAARRYPIALSISMVRRTAGRAIIRS